MACKKLNKIIAEKDGYLVIDIGTKTNPSATMLIDKFDWDYLMAIGVGRIGSKRSSNDPYHYAHAKLNGKVVSVHRILMPYAEIVDHKNHDGLDNRRENIRATDASGSAINRREPKNNTSGHVGVFWYKDRKMWHARIRCNGITENLGFFSDMQDAIDARKNKEKTLFAGKKY